MKKCRRCTKPATLHVTEIREGAASIVHLCDTCAREYLEQNPDDSNSPVTSDLASKLDELMGETHSPAVCPNCGISFNEFRESGRFGCPQDYSEFMTKASDLAVPSSEQRNRGDSFNCETSNETPSKKKITKRRLGCVTKSRHWKAPCAKKHPGRLVRKRSPTQLSRNLIKERVLV